MIISISTFKLESFSLLWYIPARRATIIQLQTDEDIFSQLSKAVRSGNSFGLWYIFGKIYTTFCVTFESEFSGIFSVKSQKAENHVNSWKVWNFWYNFQNFRQFLEWFLTDLVFDSIELCQSSLVLILLITYFYQRLIRLFFLSARLLSGLIYIYSHEEASNRWIKYPFYLNNMAKHEIF